MSNSEFYEKLKGLDDNYDDKAHYVFFPSSLWKEYNSNGFVFGLIDAGNGRTSVNRREYIGGDNVLPEQYFTK